MLAVAALVCLNATTSFADLSQKQTRKLIARMAGLTLPESSVRVARIVMDSADTAEATADIETVFRLAQNEAGNWSLKEIRAGQDRWEELEIVARAAHASLPVSACDTLTEPISSLGVKRTRCMVADLLGVTLPSDAVRIKDISTFPLGSQASATAVALLRVDVRLKRNGKSWHVTDLRTGNRDWFNLDTLTQSMDQIKRERAIADLELMARALKAFHKDRGVFVVSDKHSVLIDHLSPAYLARVIRVDPWNHPYQYEGDRDRFTIRSLGPDGKPGSDDVVVSGP